MSESKHLNDNNMTEEMTSEEAELLRNINRHLIACVSKLWISVKEKLPEHDESILVYTKKGHCVCVFVDTKKMNANLKLRGYKEECWDEIEKPYSFCSQEIRGFILNGVTHWMPLVPPIEDKQ